MDQSGLTYICETLNAATNIPVRLFAKQEQLGIFSTFDFPIDPFSLHLEKLSAPRETAISYFVSEESFYYCCLDHEEFTIVVGPFRYGRVIDESVSSLAFRLGLSGNEKKQLKNGVSSIPSTALESMLSLLCSYHYFLDGEKLDLEKLMIADEAQRLMDKKAAEDEIDYRQISEMRSYTLGTEEALSRFIEQGDADGFEAWVKKAPSIRPGNMSNDFLRQAKNIFVTSATLFSRAAIRGGLSYNDALDLSDSYILQCEALRDYGEVTNLIYAMVRAYIEKVARIRSENSALESKVANYLFQHISERITLDELCDALYMSKSNLCRRFKKETGQTVDAFLSSKRLEEAKRLLFATDKPMQDIAYYLGFSSLPHFSNAFRKRFGCTPSSMRAKGK